MFQKPICVLCLFLCVSISSQAQTITGKIVNDLDDSPIEFASIAAYLEEDSSLVTGVVSGLQGSFELPIKSKNSYFLHFQFMGFDPLELSGVSVNKDETANLGIIRLSPNQKLLDEIEITAKKVTAVQKIDRQVFEAENFESAKGGTATDIIRNLPSVSIDANGQLSARGATGFVVLIDGKPLQTDAMTILNQLPANAVSKIEFITAPSAKYDPEGKAGILNIITNQKLSSGTYAGINVRLGAPSIENYNNADPAYRYGADFTVHSQKEKWTWSLSGSYIRNDKTGRREGNVWTEIYDNETGTSGRRTDFPSDGERSFDEKNYSGSFALGYKPNKNDDFNFSFYGGVKDKTRLADIYYFNNTTTAIPDGQNLGGVQYYNHNSRNRTGDFALGSLDYSHLFANESKVSASFLYEYTLLGGPTFNDNQTNDFSRTPELNELIESERNTNDNPLNGYRLNLDYQFRPSNLGIWELGYQFRELDHTGDFLYENLNLSTNQWEVVPEYTSNLNLQRTINSGYVTLSGNKDKLDYNAGVRVESMARTLEFKGANDAAFTTLNRDYFRFFPSASFQYSVSDEFKIKGAYSKRVERTTTFKMNPFKEKEHSETLEQGYAELEPEFIDVVELGVVKDFGNQSVFANAYFRNTQNLINRTNTVDSDTVLNRIYTNAGTGKVAGVELGLDLQLSENWTFFAGGNVFKNQIEGSFIYNDRSIPGASEIVIPINSSVWQYSLNLNTTYNISKTMSINWSLNHLSERVTAQGRDSRFYSPNLVIKKSFLDNRLSASLQWLQMDLGLLRTNEQRITTWNYDGYVDPKDDSLKKFYTTTNYVYETDWILLNISYNFSSFKNKAKFVKSEFGAKEF